MLKHHLGLADEIIVNGGYSTDGTFERIRDLDPRIRIFRSNWDQPRDEGWWIHFKDAARRRCTGDWCIHLDSDEFIPDWEFEPIREHLQKTDDWMIPVQFVNFYGNYLVYHRNPAKVHWVTKKMIIHRNVPDAFEFWGDGSNVKLTGQEFSWESSAALFTVHHFGAVRRPGRLRQGWWTQGRFRAERSIAWQPPDIIFDLFPHDWADPQFIEDLGIYDGPVIKAVSDDPNRFVRDDYQLLYLLRQRAQRISLTE
jgi:hypothetical protein